MPGFDRRGPTSMGPMTGGARGMCNPRGRYPTGRDFGSRFRGGRARSRDNRNMFGAPGQSSWRRSSPMSFRNGAFDTPISLEQEMGFLKDQATVLRQELEAIDNRLRELKSNEKKSD